MLIDLRNRARQEKDYKTADYIRNRMTAIGIAVEDTPSGTRVKGRGLEETFMSEKGNKVRKRPK